MSIMEVSHGAAFTHSDTHSPLTGCRKTRIYRPYHVSLAMLTQRLPIRHTAMQTLTAWNREWSKWRTTFDSCGIRAGFVQDSCEGNTQITRRKSWSFWHLCEKCDSCRALRLKTYSPVSRGIFFWLGYLAGYSSKLQSKTRQNKNPETLISQSFRASWSIGDSNS